MKILPNLDRLPNVPSSRATFLPGTQYLFKFRFNSSNIGLIAFKSSEYRDSDSSWDSADRAEEFVFGDNSSDSTKRVVNR